MPVFDWIATAGSAAHNDLRCFAPDRAKANSYPRKCEAGVATDRRIG